MPTALTKRITQPPQYLSPGCAATDVGPRSIIFANTPCEAKNSPQTRPPWAGGFMPLTLEFERLGGVHIRGDHSCVHPVDVPASPQSWPEANSGRCCRPT
jgi:hypothetical protein